MIPDQINPPHEDSTVVTVFRCVRRKATARAKAVVPAMERRRGPGRHEWMQVRMLYVGRLHNGTRDQSLKKRSDYLPFRVPAQRLVSFYTPVADFARSRLLGSVG